MSFKFDKCKPEDFGLTVVSQEAPETYVDSNENSRWVKKEMYDFGWGNECGFMRIPQLEFEDLWELLINSSIQENKYGAAYIIEKEYACKLMNHLLDILNKSDFTYISSFKEAAEILNLKQVRNRCETIGKTYQEVENDYNNWKYIANKVLELISNK